MEKKEKLYELKPQSFDLVPAVNWDKTNEVEGRLVEIKTVDRIGRKLAIVENLEKRYAIWETAYLTSCGLFDLPLGAYVKIKFTGWEKAKRGRIRKFSVYASQKPENDIPF